MDVGFGVLGRQLALDHSGQNSLEPKFVPVQGCASGYVSNSCNHPSRSVVEYNADVGHHPPGIIREYSNEG